MIRLYQIAFSILPEALLAFASYRLQKLRQKDLNKFEQGAPYSADISDVLEGSIRHGLSALYIFLHMIDKSSKPVAGKLYYSPNP